MADVKHFDPAAVLVVVRLFWRQGVPLPKRGRIALHIATGIIAVTPTRRA